MPTDVRSQVVLCRKDDATTFCGCDAFCRTTKILPAAQPHLDEDEGIAITGDQVDFATPDTIVAIENLQPLTAQMAGREFFRRGTALARDGIAPENAGDE